MKFTKTHNISIPPANEKLPSTFFVSEELKGRLDSTSLTGQILKDSNEQEVALDSKIVLEVVINQNTYYYEVLSLALKDQTVSLSAPASALLALRLNQTLYNASLIVESIAIEKLKIQLISVTKLNTWEYNYKFKIINSIEEVVQ